MAKTRGPLLSMRARGQLAHSHIYSAWKGIPYVRQYVVPANPQTDEQTLTRSVFAWLNALYRSLGAWGVGPWDLLSQGRPFTNRNAMIKHNLPFLRVGIDISALRGSAGARGGPAMATFTALPGGAAGEIDWEMTAGPLPSGWTITRGGVFILHQQDPHGQYDGSYVENTQANPGPYENTVAGFVAGDDYVVTGWLEYEKPDGSLAVSTAGTVTTTAGV